MSAKLILVRHAERPEIPADQIGNDIVLTENGIANSYSFGKSFKGDVTEIKSSPIARCKQTAKQIADASGFNHNKIDECRLLGDPGFFISDPDLAWKQWQKYGSERVNQHLLFDDIAWPGFKDFQVAVGDMHQAMRETLTTARAKTSIWVTHDTILATFASRVLKDPLTIEQWPGFLGSLVVSLGDSQQLLYSYAQFPE
jgi:broad specificity phosphatase PhoE